MAEVIGAVDYNRIDKIVRKRLPLSFTSAGNLKIAVSEDDVGITTSLQSISNKLDEIGKLVSPLSFTSAGNLKIAVSEDDVGITTSLQSISNKLDEIGKLVLVDYTTAPLAANSTWISKVDNDYATGRIVGTVFADQSGTLYVEQSPDGNNWDVVDSFPVSANAGLGFTVEKVAPYVRVRYVNGATTQTTFRLYIYARKRII